MKVICPNDTKEYQIEDSGVINLSSDCWAVTPSMQLYPNPVEFNEKYHSIIPKANLSVIIAPIKDKLEKFIKEQNENQITSVQNFKDLNSIGTPIQFILKDEGLIRINFQTMSIITVVVSMVLCIICYLSIIRKSQYTPVAITDQEMQILPNDNDTYNEDKQGTEKEQSEELHLHQNPLKETDM